jgi:hypothetical protein
MYLTARGAAQGGKMKPYYADSVSAQDVQAMFRYSQAFLGLSHPRPR